MRLLIRATDDHNFETVRQIAEQGGEVMTVLSRYRALSVENLSEDAERQICATGATVRREGQMAPFAVPAS